MDKKYQVFISSTYTDLVEARAKVRDAILSIYHFPVGMELFGAADEDQWEIIRETIDSSDYYVLIIGQRYGSVISEGPDAGISYTEKEFRYAIEKCVPVLAFIIDDTVPVKPGDIEKDNPEKLISFKDKVMKGRLVEWWKTPDELAQKVTAALYKQINRKRRPGWIRSESVDIEESLAEIVKLSKQNRILQEENRKLSVEIKKLKSASNREPLLKVTLNLTKPDDHEKHQEVYQRESIIKINDEGDVQIIHLNLQRLCTSSKEAEYKSLSRLDVPIGLQQYISDQEIKEYNAALPSKEKVEQYLEQYRGYLRVMENGIPITFYVNNVGSAKATDVTVTIEFPNQVRVFELEDIIETPEPEGPKKPDDLVQKAYKKQSFEKALALGLKLPSFGGINTMHDLSALIASPVKADNILSSIEISNNIVEIEHKHGIVHTRSEWFSGAYIVPMTVGEFDAKVTIMCAEYKVPEETTIKFIVE